MPCQHGDSRVPLRRRQEERQQQQCRSGALEAVGDAGDHPLRVSAGARGIGGETAEMGGHPAGDGVGAVGDHVGPAWRLIALTHGVRNPAVGGRPGGHGLGQVAIAGDHQHPVGDADERRRIEPRRHAQHQARQALRVGRDERRQVAGHLCRHMRGGQPEMIPQRGESLRQRLPGCVHRPVSLRSEPVGILRRILPPGTTWQAGRADRRRRCSSSRTPGRR